MSSNGEYNHAGNVRPCPKYAKEERARGTDVHKRARGEFRDPHDPNNRRPSRLEPLSPGATPPIYRDDDGGSDRRAGTILTAVIALVAAVGLIMWFGPTDQETANNVPATTGQGGQDR